MSDQPPRATPPASPWSPAGCIFLFFVLSLPIDAGAAISSQWDKLRELHYLDGSMFVGAAAVLVVLWTASELLARIGRNK